MYRWNTKAFDGTIKNCHVPKIRNGEQVLQMVKNLKVVLGRGKGSTKLMTGDLFKKRSIF
jgi:hypothetical protein